MITREKTAGSIRGYRGFACPQEHLPTGFLDLILSLYARLLCHSILHKYAVALGQASEGLVPFLEEWSRHEATFDDIWTLGLGRLSRALRPGHEGEATQAVS